MVSKEVKPKPGHIRDGNITITEWQNKSAKGFPFKTYTAQRSYRTKDGKWENTGTFRRGDLPKLALLCQKAYMTSTSETPEEEVPQEE